MLIDLQRRLLRALHSETPFETLRAEDPALAARIDPDGFVLTSLLVRKLRFERLCRGDSRMAAWFDRNPAGFAEIHARYARQVEPRAFFPRSEADAFLDWAKDSGIQIPSNLQPGRPSEEKP